MTRVTDFMDRWVTAELAWLDRLFCHADTAMSRAIERLEKRWSR